MKFDLYRYFLKEVQEEVEDENTNTDPTGQSPTQTKSPIQTSPQQGIDKSNQNSKEILKPATSSESNIFSAYIGSTISGINFKKNGANGGEISIMVSKSNRPIKISWAGDKVTVTQPDGNIVSL